jgi:hypothetical protein
VQRQQLARPHRDPVARIGDREGLAPEIRERFDLGPGDDEIERIAARDRDRDELAARHHVVDQQRELLPRHVDVALAHGFAHRDRVGARRRAERNREGNDPNLDAFARKVPFAVRDDLREPVDVALVVDAVADRVGGASTAARDESGCRQGQNPHRRRAKCLHLHGSLQRFRRTRRRFAGVAAARPVASQKSGSSACGIGARSDTWLAP